MTASQTYAYWHGVAERNRPLLVEGHGITPRHRLVQQAELRCSVLRPHVPVWDWYAIDTELLTIVVVKRKARDSNPQRR